MPRSLANDVPPPVFHSAINIADAERLSEYRSRTTYGALDLYLQESAEQDDSALDLELQPTERRTPNVVVAIPVAGHQEAHNIDTVLSLYGKQNLNKRFWELVLYVNTPPDEPGKPPRDSQPTLQAIAEAQQKYGLTNLRTLEHQYDSPVTIGRIRRDMWDAIIKDLHEREVENPVLVVNNDADAKSLRSDYLSEYAYSHVVQEKSVITGPIRYDRPTDAPTASMLVRYHSHLFNGYFKKSKSAPVTEGNSAYDLATYCALGGIDPAKSMGEVLKLIFNLNRLNKGQDRIYAEKTFTNRLPIVSSSRRHLAAIAFGHGVESTWDPQRIPFTADDSFRTQPLNKRAEQQALVHFNKHVTQMERSFVHQLEAPLELRRDMYRYAKSAKRILGITAKQEELANAGHI